MLDSVIQSQHWHPVEHTLGPSFFWPILLGWIICCSTYHNFSKQATSTVLRRSSNSITSGDQRFWCIHPFRHWKSTSHPAGSPPLLHFKCSPYMPAPSCGCSTARMGINCIKHCEKRDDLQECYTQFSEVVRRLWIFWNNGNFFWIFARNFYIWAFVRF